MPHGNRNNQKVNQPIKINMKTKKSIHSNRIHFSRSLIIYSQATKKNRIQFLPSYNCITHFIGSLTQFQKILLQNQIINQSPSYT